MLGKKSDDGRDILSMREWNSLRVLIAAIDCLELEGNGLEKRLKKLTPGGWKLLRQALGLLRSCFKQLANTIPSKQIETIYTELNHTKFTVQVNPVLSTPKGVMYVDTKAFMRVVGAAMANQCFMCEKRAKEARRCQLYKDIQDCFPFSLEIGTADEECVFAGRTSVPAED